MSTQRYQLWPQIGLVFTISFFSFLAFLIPATWMQGSSWRALDWHFIQWQIAMRGLINQSADTTIYWNYITHNGYQLDLAFHIGIPVLISLITSVILSYWLLYTPGGREPVTHLAGPTCLEGRKAKRHAKELLKQTTNNDFMGKGIFLHPNVQIPVRNEMANLLIYGQQGSGKSVILKPIVHQIRNRGDKLFIYDRKCEYTPFIYDDRSILISPTDARSQQWDIGSDVTNEPEAELVAQRLIRDTPDPLWSDGSRLILTGCMMILINLNKPWGWRDLAGVITLPHKELRAMFETHYPEAAVLIQEDSKTTQSLFVTLISQLKWMRRLGQLWPNSQQPGFSIRQWLNDDDQPSTLIIAHDEHNEALSAPLCNILFGLMTNHVLAMPDSDSRRIWFALDELSSLPKTDSLEKWLRLGRSKGGRTVAALQSLSQLRSLYSKETSDTILTLFGNVVALRMGSSGDAASSAAASFGEHQVERRITSYNDQSKPSTQCQFTSEPLVRPEELTNLQHSWRGINGWLMIGGQKSVYKLLWPFPNSNSIAEPFERATPFSPQDANKSSSSQKKETKLGNRLKRRPL